MITAWSPSRIGGARASAGPLSRVLALAVLLFGVVFTHGVHAESVKGHLVTSATPSATAPSEGAHDTTDKQVLSRATATGDRHDGHGSSHPSEQCVSGQPHQGPVLTPPTFAASVSESVTAGRVAVKRGFGESGLSAWPSVAVRSSVVQQV